MRILPQILAARPRIPFCWLDLRCRRDLDALPAWLGDVGTGESNSNAKIASANL
jgi:hypothetical protein